MDTDRLIAKVDELMTGNGDIYRDKDQNAIINALLRHLDRNTLRAINEYKLFPFVSYELRCKIGCFLKEKSIPSREDLPVLLEYYRNKRSRKVCYAAKALKYRFEYLASSEQKLILLAFFNGSQSDRYWAAKKSYNHWENEYSRYVEGIWTMNKDMSCVKLDCSRIILAHFPAEFIIRHEAELVETAGYRAVCIAIGKHPDFNINWSRLDLPDELFVKAKLGIDVDAEQVEKDIYSYFRNDLKKETSFDPYVQRLPDEHGSPIPFFSDTHGFVSIVWALGKFGMHEALFRLFEFCQKIKTDWRCTDMNELIRLTKEGL